ncbi:MAG: thioredoxin domain-containing protein [Microbacteriaceae bacterium]
MQRSTKINLAIIGALAVAGIITAGALVTGAPGPSPSSAGSTASPPALVPQGSHVLDDPEGATVTVVEFLDFECEVCGAVYPYVEQIREDYAGEIRYVPRYFPIPAHQNSMHAALAVEAAAQQGRYQAMYERMFETQAEWGERQESEAPRFRGYAEELGLDLAAYDAVVADPATEMRIRADFDAGLALGVQGTPTFFVDGEQVRLETIDDLTAAIDAALGAGE